MNAPIITCRLCDAPAVGIYHLPKGCVCAADPVQALCAQHAVSSEPLAGMWEVRVSGEFSEVCDEIGSTSSLD